MRRSIAPAGAAQGLESDFRPHFFGGVATVCAKLFGAATPDVAVFGEKDYQQLCVVRQMVRDLNMPLDIVGVATTREADGLALSSRNVYLTAEERKVAPALNRVLRDVAGKASAVMRGAGPAQAQGRRVRRRWCATRPCRRRRISSPTSTAICAAAAAELQAAGFAKVDYVAVRHADTLKVVTETGDAPLRVLAAAWLGGTRLIDNVAVALSRPARRQQDTGGDEADAEQVVEMQLLAEQRDGQDRAENRHQVNREARGIGAKQLHRAVEGKVGHGRGKHGHVPDRQQRVPAERHRVSA